MSPFMKELFFFIALPIMVVIVFVGILTNKRKSEGQEEPETLYVKCPSCSESILADARICRFCERETGFINNPNIPYPPPQKSLNPSHVSSRKFCSKCGTRIEAEASFCENCGEKVG